MGHVPTGHELRPDFDGADDVREGRPYRPMSDVEFLIKLLVGQMAATQQQLARRPGIMPDQAVQQIHMNHTC